MVESSVMRPSVRFGERAAMFLVRAACAFSCLALTTPVLSQPSLPSDGIPSTVDTEIVRLIDQLYSASEIDRGRALLELKARGMLATPAVPYVATMLDDTTQIARFRDVGALASGLGSRVTVGHLALETLVSIGGPKANEAIFGAILDPRSSLRCTAASFSWSSRRESIRNDRRALEPLLALAKDGDCRTDIVFAWLYQIALRASQKGLSLEESPQIDIAGMLPVVFLGDASEVPEHTEFLNLLAHFSFSPALPWVTEKAKQDARFRVYLRDLEAGRVQIQWASIYVDLMATANEESRLGYLRQLPLLVADQAYARKLLPLVLPLIGSDEPDAAMTWLGSYLRHRAETPMQDSATLVASLETHRKVIRRALRSDDPEAALTLLEAAGTLAAPFESSLKRLTRKGDTEATRARAAQVLTAIAANEDRR